MENFTFYSPTYFAFGKDQEKESGRLVRRFGGHKVMIHYGGGSVIASGLFARVEEALRQEDIPYVTLGGVKPNPKSGLVYTGIELCRQENVDFILAVGGGSVIDSAKAIAAGVCYDGDFWDFYRGVSIEKALKVGTVLTIAAAGSEASGNAVITKEDGLIKKGTGSPYLKPVFSIMNPELTYTLPAYQTACGATDIMAHVFERYFTNTSGVEMTDRMCESVLHTIIKHVPRVLQNPSDYEARANIMWAGTIAHNDICGVGRIQDWSSHNIEHELSALYDVAHGAGLAVIFPAWMKYVMRHDVARFAQFAVRVWGCEMDFQNPERTAAEGIQRLEKFLKAIGMPSRFQDIGAREEDIPLMVKKINISGRGGFGKFVSFTDEDVEKIYRLAL